jgi:hypothetical protein
MSCISFGGMRVGLVEVVYEDRVKNIDATIWSNRRKKRVNGRRTSCASWCTEPHRPILTRNALHLVRGGNRVGVYRCLQALGEASGRRCFQYPLSDRRGIPDRAAWRLGSARHGEYPPHNWQDGFADVLQPGCASSRTMPPADPCRQTAGHSRT